MSKHRSSSKQSQAAAQTSPSVQIPLPVVGVLFDTRDAFHELCIRTGQQVLEAMMEADREALCGPKGQHQRERRAWRSGSAPSRVTLGGRQIDLPRLRVRDDEGEVALSSFQWAASHDPLNRHTMASVAAGVSTRHYAPLLDPLPSGVAEHSVSRSAVSRRFVALSSRQMHQFLSRPLGELDIRAVFIDGKVIHGHCLLIALGLDTDGRKHVLGLREGTTENANVATALLADLVERGLPSDRALLFVVDGAKALHRAVRDVYGELGAIQRCQFHKLCNVLAHLPDALHASITQGLRDAWEAADASLGERQLERLARSLDREHPGAASSLREGHEETLTVRRLGLTGALAKTLRTTNPIENLNGHIVRYTRNVKRWRDGLMIQRWVSAALLTGESNFRRIRGYRDMHRLVSALDAMSSPTTTDEKVA